MDLCFVTTDSINDFWQKKLTSVVDTDVLVFGFNGLGIVSYKKELAGETEYFRDVASLSKEIGGVVVCGCDTDTYGVYRHSAVIADKGKILGVSDMVHCIDDSEFVSGGNLRVYDTSRGKIGLIVFEDLYFPEVARVLTLCDADVIICVFKNMSGMAQIMMRADAFSNGVNVALCAKNYACLSDALGNVSVAGSADIIRAKANIQKDYRLISSRRRGVYRDFGSGY